MDETIASLERHYCPPLDSALFQALTLDFDVHQESSIVELRTVLDALKDAAISDEAANFDPSGNGVTLDDADSHNSSERARSWHADVASVSAGTDETDLTAASQQLEDVRFQGGSFDGAEPRHFGEDWNDLPAEGRLNILEEMFPNARSVDIAYVLKKSGDHYGRAVEELLNQAFLEAEVDEKGTSTFRRGVEGFSEPSVRNKGKKKKGKKSQVHRRTSSTPPLLTDEAANGSASPSSRWDRAKEDIDFIATRTHISRQTLASIYHKNGASLPATINSICLSSKIENPYLSSVLPSVLDGQIARLSVEFPDLKASQTCALVQLAYPSTASAQELAHVLMCSLQPLSSEHIVPLYSPRPPSPNGSPTRSRPSTLAFPSQTAASLTAARSKAYSQAASAYRRSKSKPLMGGAAAYYSAVARDTSTALRDREAAEADLLVSDQSRPGELDFHGVNVRDAVAIAKQRAESWWEREGQEWARDGKVRDGGLRMITGKGRHSDGGKGKLGPAIGASLVKAGWKVEVHHGFIDVVGKVRR